MSTLNRYVVIGDGQVARHMIYYFNQLGLTVQQWSRRCAELLDAVLDSATHVLLLISDRAIEPFVLEHPELADKVLIHFSGSVVCEGADTVHPLMTFSSALYTLDEYRSIPFVLHEGGKDLAELLPDLPNPSFCIPVDAAAYYHGLCVMANNFTSLLWNKCFSEFSARWGLPKQALLPILQRTCCNLHDSHEEALTGPLVRRDWSTIQANLAALQGDPYQAVYAAFVDSVMTEREE